MNIIYNKILLNKYDNSFNTNYLFINELDEINNYKLIKKTRKIISIENLTNYVYIHCLDCIKIDSRYILKVADTVINLTKVGESIYYISYIENPNKLNVHSLLHTFLSSNKCHIDISKYSYLFDNYNNLYLHIKRK